MKIRRVQKADSRKILKLVRDIMKEEFGPAEANAYPIDDILGLPKSYAGKRDAFFVMTDSSGKLIATCAVKEEERQVGLLRRVFVRPKYRGRQLGEKIVRHAIGFCKKKGYRILCVWAANSMKPVIALLHKLDFHERGTLQVGRVRILKMTYDCHKKKVS